MEKYYTTTKSGETVEVSKELKEELIRLGKKESNDFTKKEIAKSAYTLKLKDAQGKESFQDVEIDDPYSNPENLRSIVADIKDAGFQVVNFEPKGASQQREIDQTTESISPIFGRTGMEYLKEGSPIKAGVSAAFTAPLRIAKTGIELAGQGFANVHGALNGVETRQPETVALSSLAGKPSDTWMGNKLTDVAEDKTMFPASIVGGAAIKGLQGLGGLVRGALGGLAETGTSLGIRKGLGDEISGEQAAKELALGGTFGAGGELLGSLFKKGAKEGGEILKNAGEHASNVSREALEMAGTKDGRALLKEMAGKDMAIADEMIGVIDNFEKYIPEWKSVQQTLKSMPDVDISKMNGVIENSLIKPVGGRNLLPWERKANSAIMSEFDYDINELPFENVSDILDTKFYSDITGKQISSGKNDLVSLGAAGESSAGNYLSAEGLYDLRKALDKDISAEAFAGIPNGNAIADRISKAKVKVRKEIKNSLVNAAEQSGNGQYVDDMKLLAEKLSKKEKLTQTIGKKAGTREKRADSFLRNITSKDKQRSAIALKDLDDLIGTNISEKATAVTYSKQLGKSGELPLMPQHKTGMGQIINTPVGSPLLNARAYYPTIDALNELAQSQGTTLTELFKSAQRNMFRPQSQAQGDTLGSMAQ